MGISIGNKIELVMLDDIIKNESNKKVYVSKIFDILPGNKLQIAMPIFEGKIVPLSVSDKYSACFYTDKGLLQCNVIITSRYKDGHMFFLEVLILGQLEKVQRRQFYRYVCKLNAKIRVVSDQEYEEIKKLRCRKSKEQPTIVFVLFVIEWLQAFNKRNKEWEK